MEKAERNLPSLLLRPHHFLCIQNYRGHGYSSSFHEKMEAVITRLQSPAGAAVEIIDCADDLCMTCPHRRGSACESQNPARFDKLVCARTGISPGDTFIWKLTGSKSTDHRLCISPDNRTRQKAIRFPVMTKELLETCCKGCSWLDLCKEIISDESGSASS